MYSKKFNHMKKVKFASKLSLKKETVVRLNEAQLNELKGGVWHTLQTCGQYGCGQHTHACQTYTCPSDVCGGPSARTVCPSAQQSVCNGAACP